MNSFITSGPNFTRAKLHGSIIEVPLSKFHHGFQIIDFYAPAYSKNSGRAFSVTPVRPVRLSVRLAVCPYVPLRVRAITSKPYGIYS